MFDTSHTNIIKNGKLEAYHCTVVNKIFSISFSETVIFLAVFDIWWLTEESLVQHHDRLCGVSG
jgi:hypothetical protein